jgi:hypothetical protein
MDPEVFDIILVELIAKASRKLIKSPPFCSNKNPDAAW